MKNQNRGELGTFVRRAVSVAMIFATLGMTAGAKAASVESIGPGDRGTAGMIDSANQPTPDTGIHADSAPVLTAQGPALFCYTNYGAFPMVIAVPVGAPCRVWIPPYGMVFGVAGD